MRRAPKAALAVMATVLTMASFLSITSFHTPAAFAQGEPRLDLESQTLVVDDDPAEIVVRVIDAPVDARLRFTVYDAVARDRDAVRDHHDDPPGGGSRIAEFECTLDGDCRNQAMMSLRADGAFAITLDDAEIGESLRARPGVLPFVVRLIDDDGERLATLATSLVVPRRSATTTSEPNVRVAFLDQVIVPIARQPDLDIEVSGADVLDAAAALERHPDVAMTTEIRPETLDALAATDPETLAELLRVLDDRPLLRGPWVDMDEEGWRVAGESDQVVSQYARGNDTFEAIVGSPPSGLVRLDPDARPETLGLLRSAGATTVVVDDAQLSAATLGIDPDQPFQLLDENGVAITALRIDEALHTTLDDPDVELAAARAAAELLALSDEATTELGVLLDVSRIDPATLDEFIGRLDRLDDLAVVNVATLAEADLARRDGDTLRGELVPTDPPDVTGLAADLRESFIGVATIARMIESDIEVLTPYVDLLQTAVASELSPSRAREFVDRVDREIDARSSGIEILDGARVTLTDRRTDLPLTIVNRQTVPVNVELVLTAEKVRFPDGDRVAITLDPGETHLTIPVETLASGDARVSATLVSPGGHFELDTGSVDIRSTAISGLGLVISVIALLVLAVWWVRTIIRIRRNRGAATVSAESVDETTTEGES
ncbi:MAG: DUF6049 family protein [Acidimicrobiales bacterium]